MKRGITILAVLFLSIFAFVPTVRTQSESYTVSVYSIVEDYYAIVGTNYTFGILVSLDSTQNVTLDMNVTVYVNDSSIYTSSFRMNVTLSSNETYGSAYWDSSVGFPVESVGVYEVLVLVSYNTSEGFDNETERFFIVAGENIINGPVSFDTGDYLKYEEYQYGEKTHEVTILFGEKINETKINVTLISKDDSSTRNTTFILDMTNRTMYVGSYSTGGFPFAMPQNLTANNLVKVGYFMAYLVKNQTTISILNLTRTAYVGLIADPIGVSFAYYDVETGILLKVMYNESYYIKLVDTNIIKQTSESEGETETGTTEGGTTEGETGTTGGTEGTTTGGETETEEGAMGDVLSLAIPIAIIGAIVLAVVVIFVFRKRSA